MVNYQNVDFENIEMKTVAKFDNNSKTVKHYYNIECGFDIETTSTVIDETQKFAFMYEWTFGIKDKNYICYGRTWEQFIELCEYLQDVYELSPDSNILVVYIHNFSYEFQFMRKYFEWENVFAVDDRKPIKALCSYGIEFRDSYILSGYSLSKLAENLVSHKIEKLYGDLDYSLIRTHETKLTDKELMYCNNDVEIILDYINEQIQQYGDITKIPMTNTGRVRKFVKEKCYFTEKDHKKSSRGKFQRYNELMKKLTLTDKEYIMLKRCFMGGFTHASMLYSGQLLHNVASIDFTSSYPAVMLSEKFPMSKPILVDLKQEDFKTLLNDNDTGLMFDIRFYGLHSKLSFETYLSESKCQVIEDATINNGRVFSAKVVQTTMTDIDFRIMKQCYSWERVEIANCYKFYMEYLPKAILLSILELYGNKTTLKGVEGKEVEYLLSKGMLNSVYGMCVTDIVRNTIEYNNGWNIEKFTPETMQEQIDKYNDSKNRFLYYAWGVWVTAYARKNLWTGILNIGIDYIYSDTDSIKLLNYYKHKPFIEWYNKDIENKLKKMCDFRKIDFDLMKPKTIKGVEKLIGVWDYEGIYKNFKTLGAKRYLVCENGKLHLTVAGLSKQNGVEKLIGVWDEGNYKKIKTLGAKRYLAYKNGKLHLTVAGLSKQNGVDYMLKICDNNIDKVFEIFNDNLYIPETETGKNTHTYIDEEMTATITDYQGNTAEITSLSSVHLSPCEFTLSISKQYSKFLQDLRNGYLFTGIKAL